VLGDDAQPATSDGHRVRSASGPRHAAPRKSLLTKLHVPAGKAVALAAMPTAVLMGMGFTPHLAQADELPKNPYKPGPCVTQSDTPSPTASGTDGAKDTSKDRATPKPTTSPSASEGNKPDPTTSPSPGASDNPVQKLLPKSTATSAPAAPKSTPSPSPSKSTDPLDPLGLGNLLGGLLGGGKNSDPTPSPTTASPTPHPSATTAKPDPSPSGSGGKKAADPVKGSTDAVKKAAKALKDATATPTPSPTGTAGSGASAGSSDGKQSYPCPTYDAKALSDAKVETGIPLVPDAPWTLKSSKLSLHGLNYLGIVQVKTYNGTIKDVLKFTASGIDIGDLDQIVEGPNGGHAEVKAAPGSTSTIRNGTVTLYTESLSGNLLGLVPITFTPKAPPPLTLPELFFTDVTVVQAGQFGGDLTVPGMQVKADIG
jgi:hypothetical protein